MAGDVELYHFPPSLCSQKVRLALSEKDVAWTSRLVNIGPPMENYEPWYARINPGLVVPTLVIDGEVITDSARIVVAIDRRLPGPDLAAEDPEVQRWIALQDGLNIREIAYSARSGILGFLTKGSFEKRLEVLRAQQRASPELAEVYQRRIDDVLAWRDVSASAEEIEARTRAVHDAAKQVAEALADREWIAGGRYTLADVVWTVMLARLTFMKLDRDWPEPLRAYYRRVRARPSFQTADVWERLKPGVMLPIVGQVIATRLGLR